MSLRSFMIRIMFGRSDRKRDRNLKIPEGVCVRRDIPYGNGGKAHLLDLVTPRNSAGKLPVIVSVHGGGFVYGSKEVYQYYAANLAENGFAVINFNYRLAPESRFPAQVEDINRVLCWLEEHGDALMLDLDHVFMVGDSAGAYLASHYLAVWSNPEFARRFDFRLPKRISVRGVALNCGLYRFKDSELIFKDLLGRKISPQDLRLDVCGNITGDFPPAFVMTSHYDFLREDAMPMYECLNRAGVPAVYRLYGTQEQKHMGHVFHCNLNLPEARQCNADQCEFFRSLMRKE